MFDANRSNEDLIADVKASSLDADLKGMLCMRLRHADTLEAHIDLLKARLEARPKQTNFDRFSTLHEARLAYRKECPLELHDVVSNVGIIVGFDEWLFLHAADKIAMKHDDLRKELADGKGSLCTA